MSRVTRSKGIFEAINLAVKFNNINLKVNTTLNIYGPIDIEIESSVLELINRYSFLEYNGEYNGEVDSIDILSKYDFQLLPTTYPGECMPGVVVESYCAGTPVLTTNWRHMPEVVKDGVTGSVTSIDEYVDEGVSFLSSITSESYFKMSKECISLYEIKYSISACNIF